MKPFEQRITATAADIDELGHVNNAVWVRWIQDIATAHWEAVADPAHVADYLWVVVRHEIDYLRALTEGESVTARTWVGEAPKGGVHPDGRQAESVEGCQPPLAWRRRVVCSPFALRRIFVGSVRIANA